MAKQKPMSEALFTSTFNAKPAMSAFAHGRANLIGDHTDYNQGFVLPCLLTHRTHVSIAWTNDGMISGVSDDFGKASRPIEAHCDGTWLDFVTGAIALLKLHGLKANGINLAVSSTVPPGAGVSSSAALEIALLRAMVQSTGINTIDQTNMAFIAQKIEHDFIGTKCGIMDQMVVSVADQGQAMLLDCMSHEIELVNFFTSGVFLVIHSGSGRKLSEGLYNTRLQECQNASISLQRESLRQASLDDLPKIADPIELKRARHVISENQRVLDAVAALKADAPEEFGLLMNQSHASLAEDYDVSSPELDKLVDVCQNNQALGARLTGAGFGGCVVVLTRPEHQTQILSAVKDQCPQAYLVDCIQ